MFNFWEVSSNCLKKAVLGFMLTTCRVQTVVEVQNRY